MVKKISRQKIFNVTIKFKEYILNKYFIRIIVNKIKQLKWLLFSVGKWQMDLGQRW